MNEHQNNKPYFITEEIATELKTAGYVFEPPAHVSALRLRDVLANRKQWDGRPHPTTASTCQSGNVVNHSNQKERPPCRLRQLALIWPRTYFRSMG